MPNRTHLPINLLDLRGQRTVEGERIEYKAGWNPDAIVRTLCAFAAGRAVSRRYRNRRIGEFLKELELTEGRSTGIPKIMKAMVANGSPTPQFETDDDRLAYVIRLPVHPLAKRPSPEVTGEVAGEVGRLLRAMAGEMSRLQMQEAMVLKHEDHFRSVYLSPALALGVIEMTLPDKPRSGKQRYRLTALGQKWLKAQARESLA